MSTPTPLKACGTIAFTDVNTGGGAVIDIGAAEGLIALTVSRQDKEDISLTIPEDKVEHLRNTVNHAANVAKPKRQPTRSDCELAGLLPHLCYEVLMTRWLASSIVGDPLPADMTEADKLNNRGRLEAFLIHARNLRDFLYGEQTAQRTDALAIDFFPSRSRWIDNRPEPSAFLTDAGGGLNYLIGKHLAHLTWARAEQSNGIKWDWIAIANEICDAVRSFRELAGQEWRALAWANLDVVLTPREGRDG